MISTDIKQLNETDIHKKQHHFLTTAWVPARLPPKTWMGPLQERVIARYTILDAILTVVLQMSKVDTEHNIAFQKEADNC
jgi:hypothetical protein